MLGVNLFVLGDGILVVCVKGVNLGRAPLAGRETALSEEPIDLVECAVLGLGQTEEAPDPEKRIGCNLGDVSEMRGGSSERET